MKVAKKVEEYVREQVKTKVFPKYEAEKAEADRILKIKNDIEIRASRAAIDAAKVIYEEAKAYEEIFEYDKDAVNCAYLGNPIHLKNSSCLNSVYKWETRLDNEVKKIVDEILVTLELGGNKTDLDRMLSEIK